MESTEHYETIGSDAYKFKENLNHNWKLIKQDTIIGGYVCKKATVNYAGRTGVHVYLDIPITVGPYKFHGLPGLV
jgi:GLPGLI family protein